MEFLNPASSIFPSFPFESSPQPKVVEKKNPIARFFFYFKKRLRVSLFFFQVRGEKGTLSWSPGKLSFKMTERWRSTRDFTNPDALSLGGLSLACLSKAVMLYQVMLSVAISYFDDIRWVVLATSFMHSCGNRLILEEPVKSSFFFPVLGALVKIAGQIFIFEIRSRVIS